MEALLPDFDFSCHASQGDEARWRGVENCHNAVDHAGGKHQGHAMDLDSRTKRDQENPVLGDLWSLSPLQGRCRSDPGIHVREDDVQSGLDPDALAVKSHAASPVGISSILSSTCESSMDTVHDSQLEEGQDGEGKQDVALVGRHLPRQNLLPLYQSPTERSPNAASGAAISSPPSQQAPHHCLHSDKIGCSPRSSPGRTDEVQLVGRSDIKHAVHRACTRPSPQPGTANGGLSYLQGRPTLVSNIENFHSAGDLGDSPSDDHCDADTTSENRASTLQSPQSHDGSRQNVQHEGSRLSLSGAQRRRLRRLQEDERMRMHDPQGWSRLQQTMQAMMPYGWDKCVPLLLVCTWV